MDYIEHRWIKEKTLEKRQYQENIAQTALTGNTLCVLPTGLGKTPIAVLVSAYRLDQDMDKKILMMAPTKPLVNQHKKTFGDFLKIGPSELKVITGETKPSKRITQYKKADIIFSTPQTIRNDLKKNRLNLKNFSLLIVDEAHKAVKDYAYTYVAKAYHDQAKDPLILGLTASPGGYRKRVEEIKSQLHIENLEMRTRDNNDVKPYIQEIKKNYVKMKLTPEIKEIHKYLQNIRKTCIDKLSKWNLIHVHTVSKKYLLNLQKSLSKKRSGFKYTALSVIAELLKLDHGIGLLETQSLYSFKKYMKGLKKKAKAGKTKAAVRLVNNEHFKKAFKLTKLLIKKGHEHPKLEKLKQIIKTSLERGEERIILFAQYRDTLQIIKKELDKIENAKPVLFIGQSKKGLSQQRQIEIINEFKMGFHNILCSSSVGEEGLDITETDSVIFYEPVPSGIRKIQRAGRTGRTKAGNVTILITRDTRDEAYFWSSYHKERKMKKIISSQQKTIGDYK